MSVPVPDSMTILSIGPGRQFEAARVPVPQPGPGEVLLRIDAVTTCPQWDLHLRHDEPMFVGHQFHYPYTPGQPGHEASGVVAAVGEGVTAVQVGDRVSAWRDVGHHVPGCYAQFVTHGVASVIPVPPEMPACATAPVELAMCVGAAFLRLKEMNALAGRRVGVVGLGPAGLVATQMARAEGATTVVGFDTSQVRRESAGRIGLHAAFDPREQVDGRFPSRPAQPGLDTIVDCVGAKASVEWALDHSADVVALFGVQREDYTFAVRHYQMRLSGYPGHSREAADYAVGLLAAGKLDLAALVTHHLPLARYAEGIDLLERQAALKVCFHPWEE